VEWATLGLPGVGDQVLAEQARVVLSELAPR